MELGTNQYQIGEYAGLSIGPERIYQNLTLGQQVGGCLYANCVIQRSYANVMVELQMQGAYGQIQNQVTIHGRLAVVEAREFHRGTDWARNLIMGSKQKQACVIVVSDAQHFIE